VGKRGRLGGWGDPKQGRKDLYWAHFFGWKKGRTKPSFHIETVGGGDPVRGEKRWGLTRGDKGGAPGELKGGWPRHKTKTWNGQVPAPNEEKRALKKKVLPKEKQTRWRKCRLRGVHTQGFLLPREKSRLPRMIREWESCGDRGNQKKTGVALPPITIHHKPGGTRKGQRPEPSQREKELGGRRGRGAGPMS